jgi:hypothetical protein
VIRVYDDAGNVLETPRARGRVQRVVSVILSAGLVPNSAALLIAQNGLRCGLAHFELGAHFL